MRLTSPGTVANLPLAIAALTVAIWEAETPVPRQGSWGDVPSICRVVQKVFILTTHGRLVDRGDGLGPGGDARRPGNDAGDSEGKREQRSEGEHFFERRKQRGKSSS
jgi:hypothetical protein